MIMRVFRLLILILSLSLSLKADLNEEIESILKQSTDSKAFKNYVAKKDLKKLEKKYKAKKDFSIRIYGDSHMAADFFPRVIRDYLLHSNAVGFAYALQPKYQQNLNLTYEFKNFSLLNSKNDKQHNYPLGGIIARADKKGAIIKLNTKLETKEFKVGFLFKAPFSQNAFSVKDAKDKSFILRSNAKDKWSYKEVISTFPLKITALQEKAELGGYFIMDKNGRNIFLDTIAINGARSDLWKDWNLDVVKKELGVLKNDLIILAYGSNDALLKDFNAVEFKKNYKDFFKILRRENKNAIFILISPPTVTQKRGKNYILSPNFHAVKKAIYELAKEEKTLLFDMHEFMQESGTKALWIEKKLSLKDVHLSVKGYELMAKKMLDELRKFFD
ncbi:GDSL-type esterase/lipase family protein [Campylobacter upsaliensis]|uniref:GDSL-type esterase/lipase family protein n=1 Tax=Campylobacter upsaliensis TaxID=28080 RepID=UPI002B39029E|nr:GDSL-type esterase/lipase family protein [Campylobacter upsaliensis]MEB2821678.1 GDSL-type esterase/lipase family protein [Campylobacter upsaliensis]